MILFVDHHDSFSQNLKSWFLAKNIEINLISASEIPDNFSFTTESALIFSPGPGHPRDYPDSLNLLRKLPQTIPFLGICLGHQILLHLYGGKIEQVCDLPIHGRQIQCSQRSPSKYIQRNELEGKFVLYNSLGCKISDPIFQQNMLALAVEDNFVLATEHMTYPRIGLQFHPESFASPGGSKILQSFLRLLRC